VVKTLNTTVLHLRLPPVSSNQVIAVLLNPTTCLSPRKPGAIHMFTRSLGLICKHIITLETLKQRRDPQVNAWLLNPELVKTGIAEL
jgi:hypothetical protein